MPQVNILLSSAGRRVERLACFRESLAQLGVKGQVFAADWSQLAPALHLADKAWTVPRCSESAFIPTMLELSRREAIRLIVPNVDDELPILAAARCAFLTEGIHIAISSEEVVRISADKVLTHSWLKRNQFPTVRQASPSEVLESAKEWRFPLIAKPRGGSGSVGVRFISCATELELIANTPDPLIVQERALGVEHTVNVYVNRHGKCVCAVPHARLEVRAGEVSKGVTVKHRRMMALASEIAETLPGARGPLNIQCFLADDDIRVIEINPRFGGGYPLAHRAGAPFTRWMIEELLEMPVTRVVDDWHAGLTMVRYDEGIYLPSNTHVESARREQLPCSARASYLI